MRILHYHNNDQAPNYKYVFLYAAQLQGMLTYFLLQGSDKTNMVVFIKRVQNDTLVITNNKMRETKQMEIYHYMPSFWKCTSDLGP